MAVTGDRPESFPLVENCGVVGVVEPEYHRFGDNSRGLTLNLSELDVLL